MSPATCAPDAGEILRRAFAEEVCDRVGDLLRRATGVEDARSTSQEQQSPNQRDAAREIINQVIQELRPD